MISTKKPQQQRQKPISYEIFAPRSTEQRMRLSRIQALTCGPMLQQQKQQQQQQRRTNTTNSNTIASVMIPPSVNKSRSTEGVLQEAVQASLQLHATLNSSVALQQQLSATLKLTNELNQRHAALLHHSSELSLAADRLQTESNVLREHANDIGLPLQHYDAVDRLSVTVGVLFKNGRVVRGLSIVGVDRQTEFNACLTDIEEAVRFFTDRVHDWQSTQESSITSINMSARQRYERESTSGSVEYYKRSLVLREVALDLLREAIVQRIQQTTEQVVETLNLDGRKRVVGGGRAVVKGDVLEASLIYTRFHGISRRSCQLLTLLQHCCKQQQNYYQQQEQQQEQEPCPYQALWNQCRDSYTKARLTLLKHSIRVHLDFLKETHGLVGMARLAGVFLIRQCTVETSLFLDFFGSSFTESSSNDSKTEQTSNETETDTKVSTRNHHKADAAALASLVMAKDGTYFDLHFQAYLDTLCSDLHKTIRRGLVSVSDLDTLCQIVSVLREERSLAGASPTTMAAARILGKVIVDAQERLIYLANTVLNKDVLRFKPTPSDLDYPDMLRAYKNGTTDSGMDTTNNTDIQKEEEEALVESQVQFYKLWFPPIKSVLKILSKIFRVVEPGVFEDIALTGVQACARILKDGSLTIEKKSGVLHSDLFLVKHLLILREQLSPFDIDLRSVERQLDFSDAGKAVSKFLANRNRRLFSMSTENALVTLLREGVSTRESSIDSKRDLEDALRSACNDFIEHTVLSLAGPVLTFVEQCKSYDAAAKAVGGGGVPALREQSFMAVGYVKAVVNRALDRLEVELGELKTQMGLYMDNPATAGILLKPVIRKISRIMEEAKRFITEAVAGTSSGDVDGMEGWNAEVEAGVFKLMDEIENMVKAAAY